MPHLRGREPQEFLGKWGLKDSFTFQKYAFDQPVQPYQYTHLLNCFITEPDVQRFIGARLRTKEHYSALESLPIESMKTDMLLATATDLSLFDPLEKTAVRNDGSIIKCFSIPHPDFDVCDRIRECLLCEDSELYELFGPDQRKEFLFHIFQRLVLGGELCQYEDVLQPYLEMTKNIYKDLVGVQRNAVTGKLEIRSKVFQLSRNSSALLTTDGVAIPLFPGKDQTNPRNGLYFIIDPGMRTLNIMRCTV